MKKNYFTLILLFFVLCVSAQDLKITGVVDGPLTGGIPKAVELYVENDIADLSLYGIGSANNGGGTDGQEFTFPADAATAGSFIYVASEDVEFTNFFGFAPNYTSGAMAINGDDAIELFFNSNVIDVFGDINVDGSGQAWDYLDGWAYRNNGTGPDGTTFVLSNWTFSGINALDGETQNGTATTPFPIGTFGGTTTPTVDNATNFSASSTGTSSISLSWTLNADSNPVVIAFIEGGTVSETLVNGQTYTAGNALPNGATVLYVGNATSFDHLSLLENTSYGYRIWSYDTNLDYATGVATDATTDSSSPIVSGLVISGVYDGPLSGGVPKGVELYALQDIADLSVYGIGSANNGGGSDGEEFTFPADAVSAGSHIYIASESTGFESFFGFAPNYTSGAMAINGDDAIELFLNSTVVDVFGDINVDGTGQPWDHVDGWAYRNDDTGPDGSTFVLTNWSFSGTNALDGATSNDLATTPFPLGAYGPDLLITGVVDGPLSGGVPKAIELYVNNDIADLSTYGIGSANNGGGTDGEEFTFPAVSASAGTFIYIASESTGFESYFGFAPDYTTSAAAINGDDAIELFFEGSVIDVFGDINVDGSGQAWDYLDGWAYRNDGTGPDGSTFVLANWTYSGIDTLDGTTTNDTAGLPFPIGTYGGGSSNENPELISIAAARSEADGTLVTVSGVITVSDQFSGSAYIQDETGAIAVFDEQVHGDGVFMIGDSITITGVRSSFNEQIQISPVTEFTSNGPATNPIVPLDVTLTELSLHPAELVRVIDVTFPNPGDLLFGNSNYAVSDSSGSGEVRIDTDVTSLVGLAQPTSCGEVIGVVGKYFDLYQLLPRIRTDLACAPTYEPPTLPVEVDKASTLEIATWNIEWFGDESNSPASGNPNSDAIQKDSVKTVIAQLQPDVLAVQEIADDALFAQMVSELSGYDFILSPAVSYPNDSGIHQKVGFIYNTETVTISDTKVLLESIHPYYNGGDTSALTDYPSDPDRFYASGRLPFLMTADVTIEGETETYDFVALHARANGSSDAQLRYDMRKYDVEVLKDSLDTYYADRNLVLLGDYNDDVDETVADITSTTSSYESYVDDGVNYEVLTETLSLNGFRSYVFRENMIDHISATEEVAPRYIDQSAQSHYEFYDSDYASTASDHLPVSVRLMLKPFTLESVASTDVSCFGEADGTATVVVSGGVAPYAYMWSDGQTSQTATGLVAGTYSVLVSDALMQFFEAEVIVSEPEELTVITTEDATVYLGYEPQSCTTLEVLSIEGGTGNYEVVWSTGETGDSITVCPEDTTTYEVTITDENGCSITESITVEAVDVSCGRNPWRPKVLVCHRGRELCVSTRAAKFLLARGATLGSCDTSSGDCRIKAKAYPNPFVRSVNVSFGCPITEDAKIVVYNFVGRPVLQLNVPEGTESTLVNMEGYRRGVYYINVFSNGRVKATIPVLKRR
ncbi:MULTISPECIES: endonuclease/exonuclease/phosphatase family protein [Flavobacteriaceae]|uniref:endonuclease/exonuclease/phosphatase family protein n=1 Tax=Flavobacteriaceae TaxID=49546 RepID=UPI001491232F|nr:MULTISPECIES: endonuclease/exonuclease/phosphatase family protein [Allomuricauda]MDC6366154.1 endonuclease/exonuclease/phosphatase family protein [Muricauda sp. AC10]